MSYKNLILRYQLPLSEITPEDEYWLTIEQVVEDERATVGFVADTIDALFDTTICVESQEEEPTVPEEPVTPDSFEDMDEVLDKIAEKAEVDMSACEMLRSGTYQTDLKIIRSHPDIPYTLRLSVGKIIKTILSSEQVSVNQNVKNESSIVLPFPIQTGLRVSWLGQVIGKNGVITPPAIQALGNTLFWGIEVTGSLRAEFGTLYDLVTVEIPGIPNYVGSELGEPQSANVLAFYHYHVYRAEINPPEVDEGLLEEVCGYSISTGVPPDEDPEPEPPPEPVIQYGCIDYYPLAPFGSPVTEPWFFREKCCVDGQHDGCRVRTSRLEGGKKLSDEIINRMTLEWPGPIEFIGLGPITPAGCGTRYENTVIRPKNCCDEAEPIEWDFDNSVEVMSPNTQGVVGVTGGAPPYHWSIRGIGFALNATGNLRDGYTDTPYVLIYALHNACGYAPIEVTDGCSVVTSGIKSTEGEWVRTYLYNGGIATCPIMGQCSRDHYTDAQGNHWFTHEANGMRVTQLRSNSPGGLQYFDSPETAYSVCMERYADTLQTEMSSGICATAYRCNECFSGLEYLPCTYTGEEIPGVDPQLIPSCDQNVYAFYGKLAGLNWWGPRIHTAQVEYTEVHVWRCSQ